MAEAAQHIAILYGRNMSRGIGVMSRLLRDAVTALGTDFKAEIRETHHVHKKDAPSGTAIALREALGDASIGIESRREGEVLGDHLVTVEKQVQVEAARPPPLLAAAVATVRGLDPV